MHCSKCGANMSYDAKFCPECGALKEDKIYEDPYNNMNSDPAGGMGGSANNNTNSNSGSYTDGGANNNTNGNSGSYTNDGQNYNFGGYIDSSSDDKIYGIVTYITWIGLLVVFVMTSLNNIPRSEYVKFHMNQAMVIFLFALLGLIPYIGWIWGIFMLIIWVMGLISACQGEMKEVPLFGKIKIIK